MTWRYSSLSFWVSGRVHLPQEVKFQSRHPFEVSHHLGTRATPILEISLSNCLFQTRMTGQRQDEKAGQSDHQFLRSEDIVGISQNYGTSYFSFSQETSYIMTKTLTGPTPAEESCALKWRLKQQSQLQTKQPIAKTCSPVIHISLNVAQI